MPRRALLVAAGKQEGSPVLNLFRRGIARKARQRRDRTIARPAHGAGGTVHALAGTIWLSLHRSPKPKYSDSRRIGKQRNADSKEFAWIYATKPASRAFLVCERNKHGGVNPDEGSEQ